MPQDIQLGPLKFTWPSGIVEETLGDILEPVGATLTPATRRPRPLKLPLRIEGADVADLATAGKRLRRQVRQLLENPAWLAQGLYLWWAADLELAGWLRLGGGTIQESDPGVAFGMWELDLETPYLVGRPATHYSGRRLDLSDYRTGLVPRDTKGLIYSTDFSSQALPLDPLVAPGIAGGSGFYTGDRPGQSGATIGIANALGPIHPGKPSWLWVRYTAVVDGDVLAFYPTFDPINSYRLVPSYGGVRVWDLTPAAVYPPLEAGYTTAGDVDPDVGYGWEAVYGSPLSSPGAPLAIENGAIRLIWIDALGFVFEWFDTTINKYRREGTIIYNNNVPGSPQLNVIELTPERGVIEVRQGARSIRVILQRGWHYARVETYHKANTAPNYARLEWLGQAAPVHASGSPAWVKTLTASGRVVYWATTTSADGNVAPTLGGHVAYTRQNALVACFGSPKTDAAEMAAWSLVDARSTPVLLARAAT